MKSGAHHCDAGPLNPSVASEELPSEHAEDPCAETNRTEYFEGEARSRHRPNENKLSCGRLRRKTIRREWFAGCELCGGRCRAKRVHLGKPATRFW